MSGAVNNCTCELCHPNMFLGERDEPVVVPEEQAKEALEQTHAQKLEAAGLSPTALVTLAFAD